jgi:hypothetical protein
MKSHVIWLAMLFTFKDDIAMAYGSASQKARWLAGDRVNKALSIIRELVILSLASILKGFISWPTKEKEFTEDANINFKLHLYYKRISASLHIKNEIIMSSCETIFLEKSPR